MADPRIKQKGTQRGMTTEQLWRERDLIDQINKGSKSVNDRLSQIESLLTQFTSPLQIPLAWARISTPGGGGPAVMLDSFGISRIENLAPRVRVYFDPVLSNTNYVAAGTVMSNTARWVYTGSQARERCNVGVGTVSGGIIAFLDVTVTASEFSVVFFGRR
jgi:hypothetical protein